MHEGLVQLNEMETECCVVLCCASAEQKRKIMIRFLYLSEIMSKRAINFFTTHCSDMLFIPLAVHETENEHRARGPIRLSECNISFSSQRDMKSHSILHVKIYEQRESEMRDVFFSVLYVCFHLPIITSPISERSKQVDIQMFAQS
jgi:hypothetical protein